MSEKILAQVEELAKSNGSKVTLITVGHFPGTTGLVGEETIKKTEAEEKAASEKYLEKKVAELKHKGLDADSIYKEGLVAYQIVSTAREKGVDLIAMSTHGGGEVAWSLGSVAEKVISHAPVPVMLLPVMEPKTPTLKKEWFLGA